MAGISSKKGTISIGVQSAKGTPATAPTTKLRLAAAPSLAPQKELGRYAMTDTGQDQGDSYVSRLAVEGDFQVYLHPDAAALLFAAVLGTNVDSGANPNYTHTATPADDMLWLTIWREVGGVIFERYTDCKIGSLSLEGSAGSPLTATLGVVGVSSTFLDAGAEKTALLALASLSSKGYIYPEAQGRIKVDTVAQRIHRISLGIERNASGYQADGYGYDDVDPGGREVTLSYATRFVSGAIGIADYRTFYYGSAGGTTLSGVVTPKAFEVEFFRDADTAVKIALPQVVYAAVPVNPDPSGDPIEVEVACDVEKPTAGNIVTVTTKDQKATL